VVSQRLTLSSPLDSGGLGLCAHGHEAVNIFHLVVVVVGFTSVKFRKHAQLNGMNSFGAAKENISVMLMVINLFCSCLLFADSQLSIL